MTRRKPNRQKLSAEQAGNQPRGISDRLILDQADEVRGPSGLMVLINGTALARHAVAARPDVQWSIFTMEHFYLESIVRALDEDTSQAADGSEPQIELFCNTDLPDALYDTVLFPTDARGAAELTRDMLQAIHNRLKPSGRLIVSTNNGKDHWLHEQLRSMFGRTTILKQKDGVCYIARKGATVPKQKNYDAEFAFRDEERLIPCASRPGVFSHRRVDPGARALIRSLNLLKDSQNGRTFTPKRIVELGCGCGAVAVAAAIRYPQASVLAVDSHARAVQSTERTARLNQVTNLNVMLTSNGLLPNAGEYDLFLANPPYYSDYRISEIFLISASESLKPGGRLHLVTKSTEWHENRMTELFGNVSVKRFGDYDVLISTQP
jgi:16S rRNA (guanine1207-N2)-methyltransferase